MHRGVWRGLATAIAVAGLVFAGTAGASASPTASHVTLPAKAAHKQSLLPTPNPALLEPAATTRPRLERTGQAQNPLPGGPTGTPEIAGGTAPRKLAPDTSGYLYAGAYQDANTNGTAYLSTIGDPYVAPSDYHSLNEVGVESSDGQQAVEVGWIVSPPMYGDSATHLFFDVWINGQFQGYGADVTPVQNSCEYGETLQPNQTQEFGIAQYDGYWWVSYGDQWCGAFADSLWNSDFTSGGLTQWFGEVYAANTSSPCTQMGDGQWASSSSAAEVSDLELLQGSDLTPATPSFTTFATNPAYYSVHTVSNTAFRYGGGGAC
jgi:hypothetical protein